MGEGGGAWWESDVLEVVCGTARGLLHKEVFYCPGIQQSCIEVDGDMMSPKMFTIMGNKETLKNWKTAIRCNGLSLRRMMEVGFLDFHDHASTCTGRCVTRNGTSKYDNKIQLLCEANERSLVADGSDYETNNQLLDDDEQDKPLPLTTTFQSFMVPDSPANLVKTPLNYKVIQTAASGDLSSITNGKNGTLGMSLVTKQEVSNVDLDLDEEIPDMSHMTEDSSSFWQGIIHIGLLDEFVKEIKGGVDSLKNDLIRNRSSADVSSKLSTIVSDLGLVTRLKYKLIAHKKETDRQNTLLHEEMDALRRQMMETEKRQLDLKRKADCFDQLIELGRNKRATRGDVW